MLCLPWAYVLTHYAILDPNLFMLRRKKDITQAFKDLDTAYAWARE